MKPPFRIVLALLGLLASALLAAGCSDLGAGGLDGPMETAEAAPGPGNGELVISNWPAYIDKNTVSEFEEKTGISVDYIEDVNDNNEFFSKLQPTLQNRDPAGRSIFVVTDWMANKMHNLGYLQKFDQKSVAPAMANLVPSLQSPAFDPKREFSLPWQSGMTGLVVNTAQAPDIKSINDLFDPQYKGKITVLSEMRDTVPLIMKAGGIDPADATADDWLNAIDKLKDAVDSGQIIGVTGNSYINDMARGDVVAAIGWSGDAIQLQADDPDIQFVMPEQGCILWSDNMVIPVGAPNPAAAYEWMNYVYQPQNQAQIANYNYYFSPVKGVKPYLKKINPEAAKSPLIFPTEEFTKNCSTQPDPPRLETAEIEKAFQSLVTGG
ncbi:MAG: spermidine/putrescine ABC transporter substrate-binding protein [Solirubrobacterales bacterium]